MRFWSKSIRWLSDYNFDLLSEPVSLKFCKHPRFTTNYGVCCTILLICLLVSAFLMNVTYNLDRNPNISMYQRTADEMSTLNLTNNQLTLGVQIFKNDKIVPDRAKENITLSIQVMKVHQSEGDWVTDVDTKPIKVSFCPGDTLNGQGNKYGGFKYIERYLNYSLCPVERNLSVTGSRFELDRSYIIIDFDVHNIRNPADYYTFKMFFTNFELTPQNREEPVTSFIDTLMFEGLKGYDTLKEALIMEEVKVTDNSWFRKHNNERVSFRTLTRHQGFDGIPLNKNYSGKKNSTLRITIYRGSCTRELVRIYPTFWDALGFAGGLFTGISLILSCLLRWISRKKKFAPCDLLLEQLKQGVRSDLRQPILNADNLKEQRKKQKIEEEIEISKIIKKLRLLDGN